jgi:hypothetical protein
VRADAWLAATCSAVLALTGCGNATSIAVPKLVLGPGEHVASIPTHDPLQQAVAVVFLMPETTLGVGVISGRLFAPAREFASPYRPRADTKG